MKKFFLYKNYLVDWQVNIQKNLDELKIKF